MTGVPIGSGMPRADARSAASPPSTATTLLASVERTRSILQWIVWMRALLRGVGAGVATLLMLLLASRQEPIPMIVIVAAVPFTICAFILASLRRGARVNAVRAALWLEEQAPAGFALVTLVEHQTEPTYASDEHTSVVVRARLADAYLSAVGGASRAARVANDALYRFATARLRGPLLFTLGSAALLIWFRTTLVARDGDAMTLSTSVPTGANNAARANAPIGKWSVRVEPPAYTHMVSQQLGDADGAKVLSGSKLVIVGSGDVPSSLALRALVDSATAARAGLGATVALSATPSATGWSTTFTTAAIPTELRVTRGRANRLLLIEGYGDSIPRVNLRTPAHDSVLRTATGKLQLEAMLHDDLGLASAAFEMIISSGEGERFTARTVRVGARQFSGRHDVTLRTALDLDSMQLGPGDIVHLRAVARDAHPAANREWGSSETRSIRVARAAEYDSVSVEPAAPPEVDKSLLSQRMLLLLTEKLEARRTKVRANVLADETSKLARDQTRLRLAVGDAVFQRLGNESSAEHAEGNEQGMKIVDGKLVMPPARDLTGVLDEGDDSPVIGINKPLLEAYNAMWDAGRALELGDRKGAIPHMRIALAAIERARAASRLYLRGKAPVVILDLAKIRLVGKDTGITNLRSVHAAQSATAREREARLLRAAALALNDASSARDSIAVLRLEAVGDAPDFANALASVVSALKDGGDVTGTFVRARRVLGGVTRASGTEWSRMGPP